MTLWMRLTVLLKDMCPWYIWCVVLDYGGCTAACGRTDTYMQAGQQVIAKGCRISLQSKFSWLGSCEPCIALFIAGTHVPAGVSMCKTMHNTAAVMTHGCHFMPTA